MWNPSPQCAAHVYPVCHIQRRRYHVAVLNNKEILMQILGNRIVHAKTKWEDEGFLSLMIVRGRLAGCAFVVVVDVYCMTVSSDSNDARMSKLTMWSHEPTAHEG
jgi:hypothetical protein